jgi:hypothetical protein
VLHPDGAMTLFGDSVAEFSTWHFGRPRNSLDLEAWHSIEYGGPERNPLRYVGRNDPCPCGSGKKFKKCCLNLDRDEPRHYLKAS